MNNKITIRPVEAGDLPLFEAYFDRLQGDAARFINPDDYNRNRFRDYFSGKLKNLVAFIAQEEGSELLAGMVFLSATQYLVPILGIGVDARYAGRGLGTELITHIHAYAREKGMGGIMLNVNEDNQRAQALYTKMGYTLLGKSPKGYLVYLMRFMAEQEETV